MKPAYPDTALERDSSPANRLEGLLRISSWLVVIVCLGFIGSISYVIADESSARGGSPSPQSPKPVDPLTSELTRRILTSAVVSPAQLTAVAVDAARHRCPTAKVEVLSDLRVLCTNSDGSAFHWNLENLLAECRLKPEHAVEVMKRYADLLPQLVAAQSVAKQPVLPISAVLPLIRPTSYVDYLLRQSNGRSKMVNMPFLRDLCVVYAFNLPDNIKLVTEDDLRDLSINASTLNNAALRNLEALASRMKLVSLGAVWGASVGGNFESSLLLADTVWQKVAMRVKGKILVAVPTRDVLNFTGSLEPNGIATLKHVTQVEFETGHHQLSTLILKRVGKRWEVYSPE